MLGICDSPFGSRGSVLAHVVAAAAFRDANSTTGSDEGSGSTGNARGTAANLRPAVLNTTARRNTSIGSKKKKKNTRTRNKMEDLMLVKLCSPVLLQLR